MTTILDAKDWVFDQVVTAITNNQISINGNVYKDRKPGKGKECIVVNSITGDSEFFQANIINVNCHVPNKHVNNGEKITSVPDNTRLKAIADDVYEVLRTQVSDQVYRSDVENMTQFDEPEEDSTYINFRVRLNSVNF